LNLIEALGGLEVELATPLSGYSAGVHHLSGVESLAFVRDRSGSDDFARMARGQIVIHALLAKILTSNWSEIPTIWQIVTQMVDTDVPVWRWPQLGGAVLRLGIENIDGRVINREMVVPFSTGGGAQVLAPDWEMINPVLLEMFGQ